MQRLITTLDREIVALESLVQITQKEQQHLLAFEPQGLDLVLGEKHLLLREQDRLRIDRETLVVSMSRSNESGTLAGLIAAVDPVVAAPLTARRNRLLALLGALTELNRASETHARRQLHWARACKRSVEAASPNGTDGYGPNGKPNSTHGSGLMLNASV